MGVALQLYSVRHDCAKDLPGTVAQVAEMGYEAVEFAGYYGRKAEDLRKMLDANGLKCAGAHIGIDSLLGDNLQKSIDFHKTVGNEHLICPGLPGKYRDSAKAWGETAKLFNDIAAKLKPHGLRTGYHNHSIEFKPMDGQIPWDVFFGNTSKDVVMQLDTGNAMHGGAESVPILKKYPGRAYTLHCKPWSKKNPKAVIGEDDLPWGEIFAVCEAQGATEWYIVEYEVPGRPALVSVRMCIDNLRKMGKL